MRDRSSWHAPLAKQLRGVWPANLDSFEPGDLLDVELGLYLLQRVVPTWTAADAWTLFGGYPYGEAFGHAQTDAQRLMLSRARHYLWGMRRRRTWRLALEAYLRVPLQLRGYDLIALDAVPEQRQPSRAAQRFHHYERLLTAPPAFERKPLPLAGVGEYSFPVRDRSYSVRFTPDLVPGPEPRPHDLATLPPGGGGAFEVAWAQLERAAVEMDAIEAAAPGRKQNHWAMRLGRVKLLVRDEAQQAFTDSGVLRIDPLLHLVGMVGAGKSTLRDILAYWAVTQCGLRVTIVVGDVAETLAVADTFAALGVSVAPIIGQSTREQHIQRLHRRLATGGAATMLAHDHPGFTYLSSACPLDALRGLEAPRPLRIREAPCVNLYPAARPATPVGVSVFDEEPEPGHEEPGSLRGAGEARGGQRSARHGCPLWTRCPRHHGAQALVDAQVWVATPASLVHSGIPQHLNAERIRYLELACRRSDLVIVDEADRVQMLLDTAFAPSTVLAGRAPNSWLDEVAGHKVAELARQGRIQLSTREVDDWTNALNTVAAATDRLYALLIRNEQLRRWIIEDYFSALTLHQWLIGAWFPELTDSTPEGAALEESAREAREAARARVDAILDRFRDDPLQEQPVQGKDDEVTPIVNRLVHLTLELLHAPQGAATRQRLQSVLLELVDRDPRVERDLDEHAARFEFTLILAALHHRLDFMTTLWPRVEAALNLESTSNVLSRRPPRDYEPVIPESPMGNVLGFQFQLGERNRDGDQSGELRFFRCNGVGRELLRSLHVLPAVDDRPGPKVLLMSATSWAGTSSRYHVHVPVGAVLRPHDDEIAAVLQTSFRKEFLYWPEVSPPKALRLSGADPAERPRVLAQMLYQLAVPDRSLAGARSMLDHQLEEIEDPERRRILLLVGSYAEARHAAEYLNAIPEWTGRVTMLIADDADLDDAWKTLPANPSLRALRRGDVATFPQTGGEVLVAPLLAVERGHNIVLPGGKAAIGAVYFLARPHPRPDDIALAIHAINDWAVRKLTNGEFHRAARAVGTPDAAGLAFRREARARWNRFLTRRMSWTSLPDAEKVAFTWDQLVVMWQVIGRLVRGGAPAHVVFVDAAFAPREAGLNATDTPATSLLESMRAVLAPYFDGSPGNVPALDRSLVKALYEPLYQALTSMD